MKKTLILCLADPSRNPRPNRLSAFLKDQGHETHVLGFPPGQPFNADFLYAIKPPSSLLIVRVLRKIFIGMNIFKFHACFRDLLTDVRWGLLSHKKRLAALSFDLIIVEDIDLLPFAFKIKSGGTKIIFDAREYYARQYEHSLLWRLMDRPQKIALCQQYLKQCDAVMTVSAGLQREYEKDFSVRPYLIRSVPYYQNQPAKDVSPTCIRMVHHGIASPHRKIENMISMFEMLDGRFEMDFFLVGNRRYVARLKKRAEHLKGIRFREPVPFNQIIPTLSHYDIGLSLFEPTTFNLKHCLPNKFFEYIQAGLGVAVGPSPDMAGLVRQYGCGVVSPDFSPGAMAACLNGLTRGDVAAMKRASTAAARELCFEKEAEKIKAMFDELLPCA